MAKKPRGATPAITALDRAGIAYTLHPYEHSPDTATSYGDEAVAMLGVDPGRVHKTLCADVDGRLVVGVVPVAGQLDLKALAAAVGGKRGQMADPQLAERATGYVRGGISPIGHRRALPVVLDDEAWNWPTIYVSAGRRGLDVELAPDDLLQVTGGQRGAIGRG